MSPVFALAWAQHTAVTHTVYPHCLQTVLGRIDPALLFFGILSFPTTLRHTRAVLHLASALAE